MWQRRQTPSRGQDGGDERVEEDAYGNGCEERGGRRKGDKVRFCYTLIKHSLCTGDVLFWRLVEELP